MGLARLFWQITCYNFYARETAWLTRALLCFYWPTARSTHSEHCKVVGSRVRGDSGPGEMEVAEVKPSWLKEAGYQCIKRLERTPPASAGHQLPRDSSWPTSYRCTASACLELPKVLGDGVGH